MGTGDRGDSALHSHRMRVLGHDPASGASGRNLSKILRRFGVATFLNSAGSTSRTDLFGGRLTSASPTEIHGEAFQRGLLAGKKGLARLKHHST